jgi:hypothetical protein
MILNTKQQFINVDGFLVERDALRIAEAIRDYDPNLVLLCLDPAHVQGVSEEPFVVAEKDSAGNLHTVLRAWILDDTILERIYLADNQKVDGFQRLLKMEEDAKKETQRRYQEVRDETKDIVGHIVKDRHSRYSVRDPRTDDIVTFYDDRPSERH